jgi:Methyltransferase FkbM domain
MARLAAVNRYRNSSPLRLHVPSLWYGFIVGCLFVLYVDHVAWPVRIMATPKSTLDPTRDSVPKSDVSHDDSSGWNTLHVYYGNRNAILWDPPRADEPESKHETTKENVAPALPSFTNQTRSSYSQVFQDEIVATLLGDSGYFIDLAANDARQYSNTLALEQYHAWRGLCIEPNPVYWYRLSHRQCTVVAALVGEASTTRALDSTTFATDQLVPVKFRGVFGGMLSKIDEKLANTKHEPDAPTEYRYTVSLREILERFQVPRTIDYLSLDIEGMEFMVMEHFPFDRYVVKIMTVERPKVRLRKLLKEQGYLLVKHLATAWGETLWVHNSTGWTADSEIIRNLPSLP